MLCVCVVALKCEIYSVCVFACVHYYVCMTVDSTAYSLAYEVLPHISWHIA